MQHLKCREFLPRGPIALFLRIEPLVFSKQFRSCENHQDRFCYDTRQTIICQNHIVMILELYWQRYLMLCLFWYQLITRFVRYCEDWKVLSGIAKYCEVLPGIICWHQKETYKFFLHKFFLSNFIWYHLVLL
jgi:hypothetical protein